MPSCCHLCPFPFLRVRDYCWCCTCPVHTCRPVSVVSFISLWYFILFQIHAIQSFRSLSLRLAAPFVVHLRTSSINNQSHHKTQWFSHNMFVLGIKRLIFWGIIVLCNIWLLYNMFLNCVWFCIKEHQSLCFCWLSHCFFIPSAFACARMRVCVFDCVIFQAPLLVSVFCFRQYFM